MKRLTYKKYNGSNDVLLIELPNKYTVIAISGWNIEEQKYKTDLFLKYKDVDSWKLIEENTIEFEANHKTICSAVLKKVSELYAENFFDYYIDRYEYELKCADKGNELFESEGDA